MAGEKVVTMAWIGNGWRMALKQREIRRGKKKGQFEIYYKRGLNLKKIIVPESSLKRMEVT